MSQLFACGYIHERANEPRGATIFVAHKQGALQQVKVMAFGVSKTIFARPMLRLGFDRLANRSCDFGSIVAMNLLLPESDCLTRSARGITEEGGEALWPGECAAG